jgi:N-acyl-D-amino-acid deacylase
MKARPRSIALAAVIAVSACQAAAADYDYLLRQAQIVDGTGGAATVGDVGIRAGKISAVGATLPGSAEVTIDATGLVLAPGFIDLHTHSEDITDFPKAENFLRMGVTTIITGNCGHSHTDVAKFLRQVDEGGLAIHVGTLIGHGTVREECMGGSFIRAPSTAQLTKMQAMVERAMRAGAVGMSTGLIYVPGSYAKTAEITALAQIVAKHQGIYASHMRYETARIFTAIDELIEITRQSGVRTQLSHIKLSSPAAWGKTAEVIAQLDKARAEGLQITHDQYVYTASSTNLGQLIPDEDLADDGAKLSSRYDQPTERAKIHTGMKAILERSQRSDYSYAVISRCGWDPSLVGLTVPKAALKKRGSDSLTDQMNLVLEIQIHGGATAIFHGINEEDLRIFFKHPLTMFASDGGPRSINGGTTHPRSFGNNARVLGNYVRDEKLIPLPEAIRKMTSLPAQTLRLGNRGVIKPGAIADIVVFDLAKIADPSTFSDPLHYATGMLHILVNGRAVIRDGKFTAERPGQAVRGSGTALH